MPFSECYPAINYSMVIENAVQNRAKRETWLAKGVKGLLIQEWDLSIANKEPQKVFLLI